MFPVLRQIFEKFSFRKISFPLPPLHRLQLLIFSIDVLVPSISIFHQKFLALLSSISYRRGFFISYFLPMSCLYRAVFQLTEPTFQRLHPLAFSIVSVVFIVSWVDVLTQVPLIFVETSVNFDHFRKFYPTNSLSSGLLSKLSDASEKL